jgi:hypothetical protein
MSSPRLASAGIDGLRPVDQAVLLAAPGVVSVSIAADVDVQLTDQEATQAVGLPALQSYSTVPLSAGSGMVVAPDWIVTASHVVDFDEEQRQRIMNYAVNRLFFQGDAGRSLGEDADLFEQHRTGDPALDELLRRCYDEVACRFEIEPTVTIFTPTQIASGSTTHGLPAQVVNDLDFAGRDIAALQMIDADPLATVPLATSTADLETGDVVIALGYPGSVQELPSLLEPMKLVGHITNVTSDGTSQVIQVDMNVESGMSGGPGLDERGRVIGLLSSGGYQVAGHHQACLLPVEDIRSVLHRAKVEAARGEIDQVFEQAMDCFWNRHYGAAVPLYRQVLGLQPGHPLAEWYLAQAETRAGGIEDVPLPGTTAGNALVVRLVRLLGLAAGVVMVMAVIRRYRSIRKG